MTQAQIVDLADVPKSVIQFVVHSDFFGYSDSLSLLALSIKTKKHKKPVNPNNRENPAKIRLSLSNHFSQQHGRRLVFWVFQFSAGVQKAIKLRVVLTLSQLPKRVITFAINLKRLFYEGDCNTSFTRVGDYLRLVRAPAR